MKFSTAAILAASLSAASATSIRGQGAKASLLSKARRLEDQNQQQQQGDDAAAQQEYSFLSSYSLKLVGCVAGESYRNPETGEYESSSVIFRLCPADSCDDESATGCGEGYGDFVVGINSFVQEWLEDKREDMQGDDAFKVEEYGECRQYEVDNDDANANQAQYYVGPTCGEDGAIALGFFSDYTCTTVPEDVTFEDISNGWSLPYSTGGLVTGACETCAGYNENGNYELSEMCSQLYMNSGKCTSLMADTGYYGDESGCEFIETIAPSYMKPKSNVGAAIGWTIFALVIVGAAGYGYTKWWTQKKNASMHTDGVMN